MVGEMTKKRKGHRVIWKDDHFWVVGGHAKAFATDYCKIKNDGEVSCKNECKYELNDYSRFSHKGESHRTDFPGL